MRIDNLILNRIRNFNSLEQSFSGRVIGLVGDNGHGKTNILEALYFIAIGSSWRTSNVEDLVSFNSSEAYVRAILHSDEKNTLKAEFVGTTQGKYRTRYLVNDLPRTKRVFCEHAACVLFAPEDLQAVGGAPSERRQMVDRILVRADHFYANHLAQYQKVLPRRNKVLQTIREGLTESISLDYWTEQMILHGSYIVQARLNFIHSIVSEAEYDVKYLPNIKDTSGGVEQIASNYREYVRQNYLKELLSGMSQYGPHKDDLMFLFAGRDVSKYGSRGQQRSCLTWFLLQQFIYLQRIIGESPYVLLDDIFSELDESNQKTILNFFTDAQLFISGCDMRNFVSGFDEIYKVKDGTLSLV